MKHLLTTTALAMALAVPAMAQSNAPQTDPAAAAPAAEAYVLVEGDVLARDLIGADVYAQKAATAPQAEMPRAAANDDMDDIGEVSDLILSRDGQVKAIVADVGGFLGIGEREIVVEMSNVELTVDANDADDLNVVIGMAADTIDDAPAFERTVRDAAPRAEATPDTGTPEERQAAEVQSVDSGQDWREGRDPYGRPDIARDGYQMVEATQISAEALTGASVYDSEDKDIGEVNDIVLTKEGGVEHFVVDVGGFLGLGEHRVALGLDEVTILQAADGGALRIYVQATQDQLEAMPTYKKAAAR